MVGFELAVVRIGEFFTSLGSYIMHTTFTMAVTVWCNKVWFGWGFL